MTTNSIDTIYHPETAPSQVTGKLLTATTVQQVTIATTLLGSLVIIIDIIAINNTRRKHNKIWLKAMSMTKHFSCHNEEYLKYTLR